MDWVYSEIVKDHFMNPRNVFKEENFEFNGEGKVGNIKCGDQMVMYLKINPTTEILEDVRWQTYGCASAIASTSMLSEIIKGMDVEKGV